VDGIQVPGDTNIADKWWNIMVALGSIAFAYSYSYILLEMTARARRPPPQPHPPTRAARCAPSALPHTNPLRRLF